MQDSQAQAIARLTSHEEWCKWAFKIASGREFELAPHHRLICQTIDRVLRGEIKRLVINMPPRHGKTELTTILLASRIFAVNPKAILTHLSFSDALVRTNSRKIKSILNHPEYRKAYPNTSVTMDAQNHWETSEGGNFHAVPSGGEVTGFGAGIEGRPFDGGMILDDMMKPKDARSDAIRKSVNATLNDTVSSRLNHEDTWVIVIAQRVRDDDTSDYLLKGGTGDIWHTLCIPAINEGKPPAHYEEYSHANLIKYTAKDIPPGALWPKRYSLDWLNRLANAQTGGDTDDNGEVSTGALVFASQYQQSPLDGGVSLYDPEWLNYYTTPPELLASGFIRIDTASMDGVNNDYTAATSYATDKRFKDHLYALDVIRVKLKPMQMFKAMADFIEKQINASGVRLKFTVVRIESNNSGPALADYLKQECVIRGLRIRIELHTGNIKRYNKVSSKQELVARNKFERAELATAWFQQGRLFLPENPTRFTDRKHIPQLVKEFSTFTLDDRHGTDDILDTVVLAMFDAFEGGKKGISYAGFSNVL